MCSTLNHKAVISLTSWKLIWEEYRIPVNEQIYNHKLWSFGENNMYWDRITRMNLFCWNSSIYSIQPFAWMMNIQFFFWSAIYFHHVWAYGTLNLTCSPPPSSTYPPSSSSSSFSQFLFIECLLLTIKCGGNFLNCNSINFNCRIT